MEQKRRRTRLAPVVMLVGPFLLVVLIASRAQSPLRADAFPDEDLFDETSPLDLVSDERHDGMRMRVVARG